MLKIYAIPGLGTTEELYINIKIKQVEVIVLDWPLPEKNDTMQSYAKKFIPQINTSEPFYLMGVSFGGMICTELNNYIFPQKTILISTSKTRQELPWFIKTLKHIPIHLITSERYHRKLAYHGRWFVGFGKAYIPEFLGMVNQMKENYFKYCINIIVRWNNQTLPKNVVHIHGTNDNLLPHSYVKADYLLKDGSHAMIVFRAEEINTLIEKIINSQLLL
jgi:hypothetical protein